ncbi:ATP-binding protein [candidate division KSB1 bacterium]|nr:ATP-binding protein [candidate division KSB1 bacterium]
MQQNDELTQVPNAKIHIESCDSKNRVFRIIPNDSFNYKEDIQLLTQTFENLVRANKTHLILDLKNVRYPNASLIANLIEFTSLLRRSGGDLLLANISESARMNFMTFSPFSYLRVVDDSGDSNDIHNEIEFSGKQGGAEGDSSNILPFDITSSRNVEEDNVISVDEILDISKNPSVPTVTVDVKSDGMNFEDLVDEDSLELREPESDHIVIHSREDHLYKMTNFVTAMAERAGFDETEISRIKISVYEAGVNIIEHAYNYDSQKYIEIVVKFDSSKFMITLMDRGEGFNYDPDKDYDAVEAAEEKRTGGFGLHIIKRSMDDVNYESDPKWGNRLTLIKNID